MLFVVLNIRLLVWPWLGEAWAKLSLEQRFKNRNWQQVTAGSLSRVFSIQLACIAGILNIIMPF